MENDAFDPSLLRSNVTEIVGRPGTAALVSRYYRTTKDHQFAGTLFDTFGHNEPERFTPDDLLATSLLDVSFGPRVLGELFPDNQRADTIPANQLLAQIPVAETLWQGVADLEHGSAAWRLWDLLDGIEGLGRTKVSKLLARKRPLLFPILDRIVLDALGLRPAPNRWLALRECLADASLRAEIDRLAPAELPKAPTTLRLLDVAVWMWNSKSRSAKAARAELP